MAFPRCVVSAPGVCVRRVQTVALAGNRPSGQVPTSPIGLEPWNGLAAPPTAGCQTLSCDLDLETTKEA